MLSVKGRKTTVIGGRQQECSTNNAATIKLGAAPILWGSCLFFTQAGLNKLRRIPFTSSDPCTILLLVNSIYEFLDPDMENVAFCVQLTLNSYLNYKTVNNKNLYWWRKREENNTFFINLLRPLWIVYIFNFHKSL